MLPLGKVGGNNIYQASFICAHLLYVRYYHRSPDLISIVTFWAKCHQNHYRCEETEVQRG